MTVRHYFIQNFNSFKEFFKLTTTNTKVQTTEAIVLKEKYFISQIKQDGVTFYYIDSINFKLEESSGIRFW